MINLDHIRGNMAELRRITPKSARMMAVVKADAYGHGAEEVARAVLASGADMLAVASVDEGAKLRGCGIRAPILVLGAVTEGDVADGVRHRLIQTVCTEKMVQMCEKAGKDSGLIAEVHMKIDTGMGRIGVRNRAERDAVLKEAERSPHVRLSGAFTHFSDADDGEEGMRYTEEQYRKFRYLCDGLPKGLTCHCANSAAIHRRPDFAMDMVRAGISLYGYPPVPQQSKLTPCMRWTAKISHVKEVTEGEYISYGRTWKAAGKTRIATITCGYADGYHRSAGGKASVLIHGKRAPVLGRICMDQMMADVTGIPEAAPEDEVVLMGQDGDESISAEDLAAWSGTISYEILLSVGSRVERKFEDHTGKQGVEA